ncbi:hypothetical protein FRC03_004855 [Tulasnella sp. 419]|nr:hypothetical protein FRC02_001072 [Tulasnella sp. 418]KAG8961893.1 hypothetical protein FRC03_004855 [Tulasnella sp. 419]
MESTNPEIPSIPDLPPSLPEDFVGKIIAIPTVIYSTIPATETGLAGSHVVPSKGGVLISPSILDGMVRHVPSQQATFSTGEANAYRALLATNCLSLISCIVVLTAYLTMLYKYPRIMQRLSLRLCACMAGADLVLHTSNLIGYGNLSTDGWLCGVFGGFLFAASTMLSLFYTCAIAVNFQLVFVYAKRARQSREKYFLGIPPVLVALICFPTLFSSTYGYDAEFDYCWYSTEGMSDATVAMKMLWSYGIWCFLATFYLLIASISIMSALHNPDTACLQVSATVDGFAHPSQQVDVIKRRHSAIRRLGYRLLGFIFIPLLCIVVGVVLDLVAKSGVKVSSTLDSTFEVITGLSGFFNSVLFFLDPAVLAIREFRSSSGSSYDDHDYSKPKSSTWMCWRKPAVVHEDVEKRTIYDERDAYERKFNELQSDIEDL